MRLATRNSQNACVQRLVVVVAAAVDLHVQHLRKTILVPLPPRFDLSQQAVDGYVGALAQRRAWAIESDAVTVDKRTLDVLAETLRERNIVCSKVRQR